MPASLTTRIGVTFLCLQLAACATMKTIDHRGLGSDERIRANRTMIITTTDGEVLPLTATRVTDQAIEGKLTYGASRGPASAYATGQTTADDRALVRVPADKIETLQVQGLDGKATGLLTGVVAGAVTILYIIDWWVESDYN